MSEPLTPCPCHPEATTVGLGEPCLNCREPPENHRVPGYCRNSTRQWDWYTHRKQMKDAK